MGSDDKTSNGVTPTGRQMVRELARKSGAGLNISRSTSGMMRQQVQDWSRGTTCFPQEFVQLVGYRDPAGRPSSQLPPRTTPVLKKIISSDTPIG